MSVIETAGLKLKKEKCKFMKREVKYLGFFLSNRGLRPNPEKIRPIVEAQKPSQPEELRTFLGAVTFYARFLKNLSRLTSPLYELLKKNVKWNWTE